jgi:hypothetical protein
MRVGRSAGPGEADERPAAGPRRELAAERAEEARADVEGIGFAAITMEEAQFAKAEMGDTRSWVPAELAGHLLESTR